jgi:hypothetical protein
MCLENSSMTKDGDISYIVITYQVTAKSSDLKNKFCIVLIYFVQHFISSRSHSDSSDVVAPSPLLLLIIGRSGISVVVGADPTAASGWFADTTFGHPCPRRRPQGRRHTAHNDMHSLAEAEVAAYEEQGHALLPSLL